MENMLPLILIFGVMWLVIFLPQQRKMKAHRSLLANLDVGDHVLLSSGIYGEVTEFDGPTLFLAVADGVEIKVTKESVAEKVSFSEDKAADKAEKKTVKKSDANVDTQDDA